MKSFLLWSITLFILNELCSAQQSLNFTCDENAETNSDQLLCIPSDYVRHSPPVTYGRTRTKVGIEIVLEDVLSVKDGAVSISCFLNTKWRDPRIRRRRGFGRAQAKPGVDYRNNPGIYVPQDPEILEHIWRPDLYVYRQKQTSNMGSIGKSLESIWIATDGTVLISSPTILDFYCPMDLTNFPLDVQKCQLRFGSYTADDSKMIFELDRGSSDSFIQMDHALMLKDYSVEISELPVKDRNLQVPKLGNFSITGIELEFRRNIGSYITSYYLPSIFIVIISWTR